MKVDTPHSKARICARRALRGRGETGGIGLEEDPVTDRDEEFLLAARRALTGPEVADPGATARTGRDNRDQGDDKDGAHDDGEGRYGTHAGLIS
jgi:hypothetical protein